MALVLWIVRVLVILLIVRFLLTMVRQAVRHAGGGAPRGGPPKRQPERLGGTLVQDPQCGTYLPKERAIADAAHYFCSTTCRDAWKTRAAAGAAE